MMTVSQLRFAQTAACSRSAINLAGAPNRQSPPLPETPRFGAGKLNLKLNFNKETATKWGLRAAMVGGILAAITGISHYKGTAADTFVTDAGDTISKIAEATKSGVGTLVNTGDEFLKDFGDGDVKNAYIPTIVGATVAGGAAYLRNKRKGGGGGF